MSPAQQMPQTKIQLLKLLRGFLDKLLKNVQEFFVSVNSQKRPDYKEYQAQCNKSLFNAGQNNNVRMIIILKVSHHQESRTSKAVLFSHSIHPSQKSSWKFLCC